MDNMNALSPMAGMQNNMNAWRQSIQDWRSQRPNHFNFLHPQAVQQPQPMAPQPVQPQPMMPQPVQQPLPPMMPAPVQVGTQLGVGGMQQPHTQFGLPTYGG